MEITHITLAELCKDHSFQNWEFIRYIALPDAEIISESDGNLLDTFINNNNNNKNSVQIFNNNETVIYVYIHRYNMFIQVSETKIRWNSKFDGIIGQIITILNEENNYDK